MALSALLFQHSVNPETIQPRLWITMIGKSILLAAGLLLELEKSPQQASNVAPGTTCFDIFSPAPGDSDVISQVAAQFPMTQRLRRQDRCG
jgi:hypothetical protein